MSDQIPLPDQIEEPDWSNVKDIAMQAASFTMQGDMVRANDLYQNLAIEVMHTLYGPKAIASFIMYAMKQESENRINPTVIFTG
jgi:hypothetical protein